MKVRHGFISNSSSSSFIVVHKEIFDIVHKVPPRLTEQEIRKLEKFGFFKVWHNSPSRLEWEGCDQRIDTEIGDGEYYNFGYYIFTNQDYVIAWLLRNKIPFKAAVNYGHTSVFWDRGSDHVLVVENLGKRMEMYGHGDDALEEIREWQIELAREPVRKVSVKKYLSGKEWV